VRRSMARDQEERVRHRGKKERREESRVSAAPKKEEKKVVVPLGGGHRGILEVLPLALDRTGGERGEWDKENFPELKDVLFYGRQLLALVAGLLCGLLPLTGAAPLVAYVLLDVLLVWLYINSFLPVRLDTPDANDPTFAIDPQSFSPMELVSEGLMPALATMLLVWITAYNL
jgi:EMC6